jgi:hypothetical protein
MKLVAPLLSAVLAVFVTACGSGSAFPEATGKGSVRAVNAVKTSPEIAFLIEERNIGTMDYRQGTAPTPWDDLEYDFSFEAFYAGELRVTRIATEHLKVVKDMNYTLLLSNTLAAPTVTVWENALREFDGTETVFEAQFAHTADSLGSIDYYFAAEGVAPVLGEEVGTLSFGEILAPIDYDAGDYVLIATTSGNPNDIVFESTSSTFPGAAQFTISLFDSGPSTFAPFVGRAFATGSIGATTLPDVNYPATIQFVNGSLPLDTIDVYDDDMQTSIVVDDLPHKGVSAELNLLDGDNTFYYTPFDMNAPVHIEQTLNLQMGLRARTIAVGETGAFTASSYIPDLRPVETHAKLQILSTTNNFDFVSVFALEVDEVLDEQIPTLLALGGASVQTIALAPDSYDVYVREFGETEVLSGPIRLDLASGNVVDAILFDNVDPAILDFEVIPNN